jgi:serine/threonine protein kinase
MNRVCLLCERTSPNTNLYCQEIYCPAEMSPTVLSYGEWLGDIEIVKPVIVLRSAVLYEANHQKEKVFLKVAHPGLENTERLKREALFLSKAKNQLLPQLLPAYANTSAESDPYGRTMLGGHLLYYYVFEHVEGEPLSDILVKNPQLWINHVGWLMISLTTVVNYLHTCQILHLGLSPEVVLVRFDAETNAPRILLFDLGICATPQILNSNWYSFFALPAYTAPELVDAQPGMVRPDYRSDVHGLGLILYELLVGESAYPFKLRSDEEVYRAVQRHRITEMNRSEDVKNIANIALQAVDPQVDRRQQNATVIAQQLISSFGEVPPEKPSRWPSTNTILVVVGALLAIAFLITFAVSMAQIAA